MQIIVEVDVVKAQKFLAMTCDDYDELIKIVGSKKDLDIAQMLIDKLSVTGLKNVDI